MNKKSKDINIKKKGLQISVFLILMNAYYIHAYPTTTSEIPKQATPPQTAIEIMVNSRIKETTQKDNRPSHVYRPRTPIYHQNHPENTPEPPKIRKHLLVDHPEVNNNQGRNIRENKKDPHCKH